ncbi:MAG: quinone-dependent dihydroorotate dehydrogenase [Microbacteriaceae bacterium]|nr:quinone-dependent dihydroorotate dehydrogenase [Microbacteriaceae bacterium]MDR9443382.1 quinone-dependent dihydroorotate dehydrogenase [Microbacteriaceae bacterium]
MIYKFLFGVFLKRLNPEFAHSLGVLAIKILFRLGLIKPAKLNDVSAMGLDFNGPLGMAAGFDKNGELIRELYALGFGHVEVGTVTALAQPGNPKPRMFRLVKDRALINRMGFNNRGAKALAKRLRKLRESNAELPVIGINIGKSKITELERASEDYAFSAKELAGLGDYFVINVSSPNTPGLRELQETEALDGIIRAVKEEIGSTPLLVKIAPDLADVDALRIADLVLEHDLAGVIAANTTISRSGVSAKPSELNQAGGLSGPVLASRARGLISLLRERLADKTLISVGGIETSEEIQKRLDLGADLVQVYTGFVYGGPFWPKRIQRKS